MTHGLRYKITATISDEVLFEPEDRDSYAKAHDVFTAKRKALEALGMTVTWAAARIVRAVRQ